MSQSYLKSDAAFYPVQLECSLTSCSFCWLEIFLLFFHSCSPCHHCSAPLLLLLKATFYSPWHYSGQDLHVKVVNLHTSGGETRPQMQHKSQELLGANHFYTRIPIHHQLLGVIPTRIRFKKKNIYGTLAGIIYCCQHLHKKIECQDWLLKCLWHLYISCSSVLGIVAPTLNCNCEII